jgi:monoamine oxidase
LEYGLKDLSKLLNLKVTTLKKHLVKSRRCSWANERFTKGAYSTVKIGKKNARKDLFEPIGSLLFCGEACAIYSNPQTVHGAIDSGLFLEKYFKEFSQ